MREWLCRYYTEVQMSAHEGHWLKTAAIPRTLGITAIFVTAEADSPSRIPPTGYASSIPYVVRICRLGSRLAPSSRQPPNQQSLHILHVPYPQRCHDHCHAPNLHVRIPVQSSECHPEAIIAPSVAKRLGAHGCEQDCRAKQH